MMLKPALQVLLLLLLQPSPGSRAQLLTPSPNLWVPDLFLAAPGIPLHRQNITNLLFLFHTDQGTTAVW